MSVALGRLRTSQSVHSSRHAPHWCWARGSFAPLARDEPHLGKGRTVTRSSDPMGVLVVDDDDHVRNFLALCLRLQGFSVWAADGAEEALTFYRRQDGAITVV